ncbi:lipoprotein [Chryseomicrobium aureum]
MGSCNEKKDIFMKKSLFLLLSILLLTACGRSLSQKQFRLS